MMITERQQQAIDDVMDQFDFERVHRVMTFLQWMWSDEQGSLNVPELSDVRRFARRIMKNTMSESNAKGGPFYIESGGFCCHVEDEVLNLKFVIEDWMVDYAK